MKKPDGNLSAVDGETEIFVSMHPYTTRILYPWIIPFLSSGGGGTHVAITDVALMAVTVTLLGDSLGSE